MAVTAQIVRQLREQTGAGMMDCKRALQASDGNIDKALEAMRQDGIAKAAKKASRIAANGLIHILREAPHVVMAEINSETDFVAKDKNFSAFCEAVVHCIATHQPADVEALMALPYEGGEGARTVAEARQQLVAKMGENISIRRFTLLDLSKMPLGTYLHGVRIGVIVRLEGGDEELAHDIAMHIAATNPLCIDEQSVPEDLLAKEQAILQARAEKNKTRKSPEIIEKMLGGQIKKFLREITLLGQVFVKNDPDQKQTVGELLKSSGAVVKQFIRYELGEGLEKRSDNFAEEVTAQVQGETERPSASSKDTESEPVSKTHDVADAPASTLERPHYRRVLIKLSGEALMGDNIYGIDPGVIVRIAGEVSELQRSGIEVAIVIGGGNILRGAELAASGIERVTGDHMGMLATVINALAMQSALEQFSVVSRVMSAISINSVCEDYIRRRAISHLEKGRVILLAAGTGNPFFTTDSAASLRAIEINADLLIKATKVDGVYSVDPATNKQAKRYTHLSYDEVLERKLEIMDATAIVLCRENNVPLRVLDMRKAGGMLRAVQGADEGTLVCDK